MSTASGAPSDPTVTLSRLNSLPPAMKSSMQRDAEAGRALELDAIGGALLRAAERAGVPVPVTARVVGELGARA